MLESMTLDFNCGLLAEGLRCYRERAFFMAHEHWEDVWRSSVEPEKTFLQALIQIAAAFHHLQRGNAVGAASLLQSAMRRLGPFPDSLHGIPVSFVRDEIRAWLDAFASGNRNPSLPFPSL